MTSEPQEAFVWIWLPGATDPVVAGRLDTVGEVVTFTYGRSYLEREERIPLFLPELPLRRGRIVPLAGTIAGRIADAGPDAWGQRGDPQPQGKAPAGGACSRPALGGVRLKPHAAFTSTT